MKQIVYDYDRLREAIVLLLSARFGESREQRVREAIALLPKGRGFTRTIEPLNEIIRIARQSPTKALDILDLVPRKRAQLIKRRQEEAPLTERRRKVTRENLRAYRTRIDNTLRTEEIRLQRKLTREEAEKLISDRKKLWNIRWENYRSEHPELKYQDAREKFTDLLNQEVQERYDRAAANGAVKKRSEGSHVSVPNGRLRDLERKFNR